MKKGNKIFIFLILLFLILLVFPESKEEKFISNLIKELNSDKQEIKLADITDFEWEKLCVFGPYAAYTELVRAEMGKKYIIDNQTWTSDDGVTTFIFGQSSGQVIVFDIYRNLIGYNQDINCFTPDSATLLRNQDVFVWKD